MSTTRHVDLWCDAPDCGHWYGEGERTAADVRRAAARRGWSRARAFDGWRDLCPRHTILPDAGPEYDQPDETDLPPDPHAYTLADMLDGWWVG